MQAPKSVSRREFIRLSGLAAGAAGLAISTIGRAADLPTGGRDADTVLAQLLDGNKRFMRGELAHPRRPFLQLEDPFGHHWHFATHVEDILPMNWHNEPKRL